MPRPVTGLRQRLAELRGPAVAPRPLDARALAALAANPGCRRRTLLDGAGVDKRALAGAMGSPATFGQSQFAHQRGNMFEARVKADGGAELLNLLYERLGGAAAGLPAPVPGAIDTPDLSALGPEGRTARTALALREATAAGRWALLDHPMVSLDVAGSPSFLEPDAVVVHPDGSWTVVEIKSFPVVDGAADPAKVGAAARQAAVYVLGLERVAERLGPDAGPDAAAPAGRPALTVVRPAAQAAPGGGTDDPPEPRPMDSADAGAPPAARRVRHRVLLVCPKDFSNLPTAELVDVRKQLSVTRRQLTRLTRVEEITAALPADLTFDLRPADDGRTPTRPAAELAAAVDAVDAAYAPECLAACELAFHCRERARAAGSVEALGRGVRGELGGLTTVAAVLAAASGTCPADRPADGPGTGAPTAGSPGPVPPPGPDRRPVPADSGAPDGLRPDDPTVQALRRAAALRAEALTAGHAALPDRGTAACD
ncbi:hypothetical protein [Streptomyces sp. NPDC018031]|uniref:hypothetical protein n=1 Tax=Streptomyces sp. NPDC018031 TaxID=3365033 RepID=UPI00378AB206